MLRQKHLDLCQLIVDAGRARAKALKGAGF